MSEFFRGWRRKMGCATLLLSCLFMAGWVRSSQKKVELVFFNGVWPNHAIVSGGGQFRILKLGHHTVSLKGEGERIKILFTLLEWSPVFTEGLPRIETFPGDLFDVCEDSAGTPVPMFVIPYWSIVVPLTLLSAALLFIKPRGMNQLKIVETLPEKVM